MRRTVLTGFLIAIAAAAVAIGSGALRRPFAPEQPIDFSHRDHVQTDQLDCELCHSSARRSAFAGVAPVERCMGCHRYVATGHPEIAKLRRAWNAGKTIEWIKVYALPPFVRFNHEAHALAKINCDACHGDVASMSRIARVVEPSMGWCVRCHRDRHAPVDCLICHY